MFSRKGGQEFFCRIQRDGEKFDLRAFFVIAGKVFLDDNPLAYDVVTECDDKLFPLRLLREGQLLEGVVNFLRIDKF